MREGSFGGNAKVGGHAPKGESQSKAQGQSAGRGKGESKSASEDEERGPTPSGDPSRRGGRRWTPSPRSVVGRRPAGCPQGGSWPSSSWRDCGYGEGRLLSPGVQAGRSFDRCRRTGKRGYPESQTVRDNPRGGPEAPIWEAGVGVPGAQVSNRMRARGDSRRPRPCHQDEEDSRPRERRWVGPELGEGSTHRGRAWSPEEKTRGEKPLETGGAKRPRGREGRGGCREKEKKKKKSKKDKKSDQETSQEVVAVNGTRPKAANRKEPKALFEGTGLDPRERVRARVFRNARKHLKRKGKKSSSSSTSGTSRGTESDEVLDMSEETVFQAASKVRLVAEGFPGALAGQALAQMRRALLSEIGQDDRPGMVKGVALAYYRQVLQGRAKGPAQRELLTTATAIDSLISGKVASTVDLLVQRLKSSESTLSGNHWTVSQRLEILPGDHQLITQGAELLEARKETYTDYRLRRDAGQPDGRPGIGGKGVRPGKDSREEPRRQGGKKGGKGQNMKGDQGKKAKEDAGRDK